MENLKKIPQRLCVACRQKKEKENLIRIVKNKEGKIYIDENKKSQGRGAYLCKDLECFDKLKKKKGLERSFKCFVDKQIYFEIETKIRGV